MGRGDNRRGEEKGDDGSAEDDDGELRVVSESYRE